MTRAALFLDRDGVINVDVGYCHRIQDFRWIPGVFDTVRTANSVGLAVVVVTNQAGIARGLYTEQDFRSLTAWMVACFEAENAPLVDVVHCPFHPDGLPPFNIASPLRKPEPGMLLQAADRHGLDLGRSLLIGDQETDIAAGRAAGLGRTALFAPTGPRSTAASAVLSNHAQACAWVVSQVVQPPATAIGAAVEPDVVRARPHG